MPIMKKLNVVIGLLERTCAALVDIYAGGTVEGIGENAQGQDLTDPMLKSLRDKLAAMPPHPSLAARFNRAFVLNLNKLPERCEGCAVTYMMSYVGLQIGDWNRINRRAVLVLVY